MPEDGDYVLGTKYEDGDPRDNWAVGFYRGTFPNRPDRHNVADENKQTLRPNGFRRVGKISQKVGKYLLDNKNDIEAAGTDLWTIVATFNKVPPAPASATSTGEDDSDFAYEHEHSPELRLNQVDYGMHGLIDAIEAMGASEELTALVVLAGEQTKRVQRMKAKWFDLQVKVAGLEGKVKAWRDDANYNLGQVSDLHMEKDVLAERCDEFRHKRDYYKTGRDRAHEALRLAIEAIEGGQHEGEGKKEVIKQQFGPAFVVRLKQGLEHNDDS